MLTSSVETRDPIALSDTLDSQLRNNTIGNRLLEGTVNACFSAFVFARIVSWFAKGAGVEQRGILGLVRAANR